MNDLTGRNEQGSEDDALYAVLGVVAQTGSPNGPRPDGAELREYLRGNAAEDRAEEIRSHLALDPTLLEQAIGQAADVTTAADKKDTDPAVIDASGRFTDRARRRSMAVYGGLGALAASVLIAVALVFFDDGGSSQRRNVRVVQTAPTQLAPTEQDASIIRLGFSSGSSMAAVEASPEAQALLQACAGDCGRQSSLLRFGATLRALRNSCRSGASIEDQTLSELRALATGPDAISQDPWQRYLADLLAAERRSGADLCRVVAAMTAGF